METASQQPHLAAPVDIRLPPRHPGQRPAKVTLFAVDSDEDLVNVKGIAVASVLSLQSSGMSGTLLPLCPLIKRNFSIKIALRHCQ